MNVLFDFIHNEYKPFTIEETVANAQDFFNEVTFSHFPVLDEGVFLGNISGNDIETFEGSKKLEDYKYILEGFFVKKNTAWLDVLEEFAQNDANILPVLDNDTNKYIGFYEVADVIQFLNQTPFLKEPGGTIVVQKNAINFSFSQITQIVEGNNGRILGIFISDSSLDSVQITVKLASGGINEIIQTFRRYEYEIISEHQEDNYIQNLKERSDYLDRYLNI